MPTKLESAIAKRETISPKNYLRKKALSSLSIREVADELGVKPWDVTYYIRRNNLQGLFPNNKQNRWAQKYKVRGEYLTLREISAKYGVSYHTLYRRIKRGYSGESLLRGKNALG